MDMYTYICIRCIYTYMDMKNKICGYGVATISRHLKIIGLFCAKEPYKRDYILQKRPIILRSLLIITTLYAYMDHIYILTHKSLIHHRYFIHTFLICYTYIIDMSHINHTHVTYTS